MTEHEEKMGGEHKHGDDCGCKANNPLEAPSPGSKSMESDKTKSEMQGDESKEEMKEGSEGENI